MKLKDSLNSDYIFTPYIAEIAVVLKNPLQTLILCNLLNKLPTYNAEATTKQIYGQSYHVKRNQSLIFEKELGVPKQTFTDNINLLSDYVSYFGGKDDNGSGYNTTFYHLNMDAIRILFDKGKKILGKSTKVVQSENKEVYKKPPQSNNKSPLANIDNYLNSINIWQTKLNNNEIDEDEFNRYFQSLKMKLSDNKVEIKYNNSIKLWQKK
jgi:hypothetical protein